MDLKKLSLIIEVKKKIKKKLIIRVWKTVYFDNISAKKLKITEIKYNEVAFSIKILKTFYQIYKFGI